MRNGREKVSTIIVQLSDPQQLKNDTHFQNMQHFKVVLCLRQTLRELTSGLQS